MWLTGQWFTEPCSGQLSTALTLYKACEHKASQLKMGLLAASRRSAENQKIFFKIAFPIQVYMEETKQK